MKSEPEWPKETPEEGSFEEDKEDKKTPGPYFKYFMVWYVLFFVVLIFPVVMVFVFAAFVTLLGIPTGIRIVGAVWCLLSYQIDVHQVVRADRERVASKVMRTLFRVLFFPFIILLGAIMFLQFFFLSLLAPLFSFIFLPILCPGFWVPKKRKGLRRSFLQAVAVIANTLWSMMRYTACKGNWDIDEVQRGVAPHKPSTIEKYFVFVVFIALFLVLPINDMISDFLYSKTLLDVYLLRPDLELYIYVIVSFFAAGFGCLVTVYTVIRVAIGFFQARSQVPSALLLYPYFQLEIIEDFTQSNPLKPRLRSHVLKFIGTVLEDAVQLIILYLTSPITSSYSNSFYFSLATSIFGIALHWSQVLTMLMTFQAVQRMFFKVIFRLFAFAFIAGALALPLIVDLSVGTNPFCLVEQIYSPLFVDQYEPCSFVYNLVVTGLTVGDLKVSYDKSLASLTITDNPDLESVSFPELQHLGALNITANPLLKTASFPVAQADFDITNLFPPGYIVFYFFHFNLHLPSYGQEYEPKRIEVVNNTLLETVDVTSQKAPDATLVVDFLQVSDNPRLRSLGIPASRYAYNDAQIQRNSLLETITIQAAENGQVLITDNENLRNATVTFPIEGSSPHLTSLRVTGNAILETLTLNFTDHQYSDISVYITGGPSSSTSAVVIANNPNLVEITLPFVNYFVDPSFTVFNFHGVISFADQKVTY